MKATGLKTLVAHYIEDRRLLDKSRLQLVALSGGADSVALLLLLRDLGYRLEAVHCNFQLRGDEADRDEDFCQSLCDELALPLHRAHFDTRAYAQLHGISIEMAARQLRYAYFRQLREAIGAEAICVAHHRDDSVETILLNLIRGTGIHGLTGMKPRQGDVVRPLLCVSRADLVSYLDGLGRSYVTDSSNLVADVKRNKVRLQILPMIEAINPSFRDTVLTMAAELEGIEQVVDTQLAHYAEATELSIEAIQQEPSAELALYYFLQPRHFNPSQIRQIADHLAASSGSRWISPTHELLSDRGRLTIHPLEADAPRPMRIPETGRYSYANEVTIRLSRAERDDRFVLPTSPETVALDADKVRFPLIIRRTQPGDRFVPLGMKGGKLVSDFLTDQKKSVWEKRHQVVVCDAEDQILWIVGNRIDHRVRITDSTRRVLLIENSVEKQNQGYGQAISLCIDGRPRHPAHGQPCADRQRALEGRRTQDDEGTGDRPLVYRQVGHLAHDGPVSLPPPCPCHRGRNGCGELRTLSEPRRRPRRGRPRPLLLRAMSPHHLPEPRPHPVRGRSRRLPHPFRIPLVWGICPNCARKMGLTR